VLLDGIRGLAALAVVLHHMGIADIGHFSVMIFFVISGYCITASADSCMRSGRGLREFMFKRVRRIYPPYILAVVFFAVTRALKVFSEPHAAAFNRPWTDWLQNLTLTQWIHDLLHPVQWPGQNPILFVASFWSLNYEEQFYIVTGLCLLAVALRVPMIVSILVLVVLGVLWNWLIPGNRIYGLFIEYWVHFALGSCLFFVLCRVVKQAYRRVFVGAISLLGVACLTRVLLHPTNAWDDLRAMVELSFLAGVTLILYFLRPISDSIAASRIWRPFAALGTISYSLYLIHQFNLNLVSSVARQVLPIGSPNALLLVLTVVLHVTLATIFWFSCERPFLPRNAPSQKTMATGREDIRIA
jgi:peptidoglycan/LPS O-acetylase OafA/YrhL